MEAKEVSVQQHLEMEMKLMKPEAKFKYDCTVMSGNKIWPNSFPLRRVEESHNELVSSSVTDLICD